MNSRNGRWNLKKYFADILTLKKSQINGRILQNFSIILLFPLNGMFKSIVFKFVLFIQSTNIDRISIIFVNFISLWFMFIVKDFKSVWIDAVPIDAVSTFCSSNCFFVSYSYFFFFFLNENYFFFVN